MFVERDFALWREISLFPRFSFFLGCVRLWAGLLLAPLLGGRRSDSRRRTR